MKHYILFTLFIIPFNLSAQVLPTNYWAVKWVHTAVITPQPVHLRFGLDKSWGKYGITLQVGATIPWSYSIDDTIVGTKSGYAARLGWRQYYPANKFSGYIYFFYGLDAFYNTGHNKGTKEYRKSEPGGISSFERYTDEYAYTRTIYGATVQIGFQYHFSSHFYLELCAGFGGKIVSNVAQYRDNINDSYAYPYTGEPVTDRDFSSFSLAMPVLGSIGYRF